MFTSIFPKRTLKGIALAAAATAALAMPALAQDAPNPTGKFQVRVGVSGILPDESANISVIGGDVDISDEYVPTVQLEYFFTDNVSAELLCCMARHDVKAVGTALGTVNLGKVSHFPPTVTLKYHWTNMGKFRPYVGAGVNYTTFFDVDEGDVTSIKYDDSFGGALQAGMDYQLNDTWSVNVDVRKIWIQSDVTIMAGATRIDADVDINPLVVTAGLGYRF
ncbi:MAG: OmpW family outer membrane protein [Hyphomonadaceae bacterium]